MRSTLKVHYIEDILKGEKIGKNIELFAWIASKREIGKIIFLDLVDSTGKIQALIKAGSTAFTNALKIKPESSVKIKGIVRFRNPDIIEIEIEEIELIGDVLLQIDPRPRSAFNIFDQKYVSTVIKNRHLYLRNEKLMAVLRVRHLFFEIIRDWFRREHFIEFHAPILTELLLYDDSSSFKLNFFNEEIFLTQCTAYYLESAIHAFERVYCVNPSFRAEKSRGKRHLAEYWHVKAEIAFADLEDIINFVEKMVSYIIERISTEAKKDLVTLGVDLDSIKLTMVPYRRIGYEDALQILNSKGINKRFGKSLSESDETIISEEFDSLFWITGIPRVIEAFPYKIEPEKPRLTKTADLIATEGFGELLGVAEKISRPEELLERMKEKGKDTDKRYDWYTQLRKFGSVPHSGFGMGVERMVRWLLRLDHVRDAIPFPRLFRHHPNP